MESKGIASAGLSNLDDLKKLFRKALSQTEQLEKTLDEIRNFTVRVDLKP